MSRLALVKRALDIGLLAIRMVDISLVDIDLAATNLVDVLSQLHMKNRPSAVRPIVCGQWLYLRHYQQLFLPLIFLPLSQ